VLAPEQSNVANCQEPFNEWMLGPFLKDSPRISAGRIFKWWLCNAYALLLLTLIFQ